MSDEQSRAEAVAPSHEPTRRLQPPDPPMTPFALGGMAAWAVAGLVLLAAHGWVREHGHTSWLWTCLAGFLLGLPGLAVMRRHDANRRARRASAHD